MTEPQITFENPKRGIDNKQVWLSTYSDAKSFNQIPNSTSHEKKEIPFELSAKSSAGQEIYFTGKTPDSKRLEEATVTELKIGKDKFKLYPPLQISFANDGALQQESAADLKKLIIEKPIAQQSLSELISSSKTRLIPEGEVLTFIEIAQNSLGFSPGQSPTINNGRKIRQR